MLHVMYSHASDLPAHLGLIEIGRTSVATLIDLSESMGRGYEIDGDTSTVWNEKMSK